MDKPALARDQAIWIAIRILGFTFALKAFLPAFQLISCLIMAVSIGVPSTLSSALYTQSVLFQIIVADFVIIFFAVYLLFFAKWVHRLIDKTTPAQDDNTCLSTLLATITVRIFGVWFIIRGIIKLTDYFLSILNIKLVEGLTAKIIEDGEVPSDEFIEILNLAIPKVTVTLIVDVLFYSLAAFYFLKYGKLVIRLLTCNRKSSAKNRQQEK